MYSEDARENQLPNGEHNKTSTIYMLSKNKVKSLDVAATSPSLYFPGSEVVWTRKYNPQREKLGLKKSPQITEFRHKICDFVL